MRPSRTSLKAVDTGLFGLTESVSGGAPLLSCLARFVTTLTSENFESTCESRPSRSPNTESDILVFFDFLDPGVRVAVDAHAFGPNDRFEVLDRDVGVGFFVDEQVVEEPNVAQFFVGDG